MPAAPTPSVRAHTHLQCRVEDDVPPTAASARQQNPQSAGPTPTRLCFSRPCLPLQPRPQVPLLGPRRPSGAEAELEARITRGLPQTLTSCTRRSALRPGCPTPSGAGGPSASGCTWGRPGVGAGGPPLPTRAPGRGGGGLCHHGRGEATRGQQDAGCHPPMVCGVPAAHRARWEGHACGPDTKKSQEAGPWDGVWNTWAGAAAAGSSLGVGGGQRPREAAEM